VEQRSWFHSHSSSNLKHNTYSFFTCAISTYILYVCWYGSTPPLVASATGTPQSTVTTRGCPVANLMGGTRLSRNSKMKNLVDPFKPIWAGPAAFIEGMRYSLRSPNIRATYKRFFLHFVIVTIVGYILLSATVVSVLPLAFLILLGPILGTLTFILFSAIGCFVGFILWLLGRFPSWLLFAGNGILSLFFSLPQMAFLLTALLTPTSEIEFSLLGMDACYYHDTSFNPSFIKAQVEKIRREYKKPHFSRKIKIIMFNFCFGIITKLFVLIAARIISSKSSNTKLVVEKAIMGFATGSQFVSIYTLHLRQMSIRNHLKWCFQHVLELIGFCLPLQLMEHYFTPASTILCLGIGQAAAAPLVKELMLEQVIMVRID